MNDKNDDIRARLALPDGREVWRDGQGRYFDAASGEELPGSSTKSKDAQAAARRHLLAAVRDEKQNVDNEYEAWGYIVGAQAVIALAGEGTKSTTAAKFVAQATGMLEEGKEEKKEQDEPKAVLSGSVMGPALAERVIEGVEDVVRERRGGEGV